MADINIAPVAGTPTPSSYFIFADTITGTFKKAPLSAIRILFGIPAGGAAGQVLSKTDGSDYSVQWINSPGGALVSSVNTRTGAITLAKIDVGLDNVDNTTDVNKPVSTATQSALNAKQATLVSGTNIRTVNGQSVLGSGNIGIAAPAFSNIIYLANYPGLDPTFTNDNTTIFQQAIMDAVAQKAGTIIVPNGHYKISSPLITSDGLGHSVNNCQLYVPYCPSNDTLPRIKFKGENLPNWSGTEVFIASNHANTGTVIESTIIGSGSNPSVFGSAYANESYSGFFYGDFNFTFVDFENVVIRTRSKTGSTEITPSMSAINGRNYIAMTADWVKVETQSSTATVLAPGAGTAGIIFPNYNNRAVSFAGKVYAEGYETGVIVSEHFQGNQIIASGCTYALGLEGPVSLLHEARLLNLTAENCKYFVRQRGALNIKIDDLKGERHRVTGHVFEFVRDLQVESGATGIVDMPRIYVTSPTTVPGFFDKGFTTNDFSKVRLKDIAGVDIDGDIQTLTPGSSIVLDMFKGKNAYLSLTSNSTIGTMPNGDVRPEFTLMVQNDAAGSKTLTPPPNVKLSGATPSTIAKELTEYAFRFANNKWYGVVNTFDANPVAVGSDNFNRADSSTVLGNAQTPNTPWVIVNGVWGIQGNKAYCPSLALGGTTTNYQTYINWGVSDFTLEAKMIRTGAFVNHGLIFRWVDAANYLYVGISNGSIELYQIVAGGVGLIQSFTVANPINVDIALKIVTDGTSVKVFKDGTQIINSGSVYFVTATRHGMNAVGGSSFDTGAFFDDFNVSV